MININVIVKGSEAIVTDDRAGNAHEHKVKQLVFLTDWPEDTESYTGDPLIKTILFVTPNGKHLNPVLVVDNKIPLESSALDAEGTLEFTVYGKVAGVLAHNARGALQVGNATSDIGGVAPAEYTDITTDCVAATNAATAIAETVQRKLDAGEFNGSTGSSAYQIAQTNGFSGTQEEWLMSLKGADGEQGIQGIQGIPGESGSSNFIPLWMPLELFNGATEFNGTPQYYIDTNTKRVHFDGGINCVSAEYTAVGMVQPNYAPKYDQFIGNSPIPNNAFIKITTNGIIYTQNIIGWISLSGVSYFSNNGQ